MGGSAGSVEQQNRDKRRGVVNHIKGQENVGEKGFVNFTLKIPKKCAALRVWQKPLSAETCVLAAKECVAAVQQKAKNTALLQFCHR